MSLRIYLKGLDCLKRLDLMASPLNLQPFKEVTSHKLPSNDLK